VALKLGELVAYLKTDDSALRSGLQAAEGKVKDFGSSMKTGLKTAGAAAGAAVGGALAMGVASNLEIGEARAKLTAQLGLTKDEAAKYGDLAGKVYASNFGGSLTDVNEAVRSVKVNLGDIGEVGEGAFTKATEAALTLSSVFGVDVAQSAEAAGKMVKNGLAKNSEEAFDIIAAGMTSGVDKSGDFLDTLNEYSPQFKKLGISGTQALGILQDGLKAGARDTDGIADAFKEFSLRSIDGSKLTADAYKAMGYSAKEMAAEIAKGGPAAEAATSATLDGLLSIKDPIKQNAAGVALFGTQWEDTLRGILPAVAGMRDAADSTTGAMQKMSDAAGDSGAAQIETLKRSVEGWVTAQTSADGAVATTIAGLTEFGPSALSAAGSIGMVVAGLGSMNIASAASAVWSGIVTTATGLWTGAQWLLNAALTANPIGIVIVVIAALVAAVIVAYKKSETFRAVVQASLRGVVSAFGWLWDKAKAVFGWIKGNWKTIFVIMTGPVGLAVRAIVKNFDKIMAAVRKIPGKIRGAFSSAGTWLKDAGRRIIQGLIDAVTNQFDRVRDKFRELTNMIPNWKGPADRDDALLRKPADLIMGGFAEQLESHFGGIEARLGGFTSGLAGIPAPRAPGQLGGAGGRGAAGAGTLRIEGDGALVEALKKVVRSYGGGNVQVAFGDGRIR
jgi:phage-related minor tail protein